MMRGLACIALLLPLAACANGVDSDDSSTLPQGGIQLSELTAEETWQWLDHSSVANQDRTTNRATIINDDRLILLLSGSSSCPPEVESVTVDETELMVSVKPWGEKACTADFAWFGFEAEAGEFESVQSARQIVEGEERNMGFVKLSGDEYSPLPRHGPTGSR